MDEKYMGLKKQLSELCSLKPEQILLAEVHTSNIKVQKQQEAASALHKHTTTTSSGAASFEIEKNS